MLWERVEINFCLQIYSCPSTICWREYAQSCLTLVTQWTGAHQAPPSVGFSRKECWSGLPFPRVYTVPVITIKACIWTLNFVLSINMSILMPTPPYFDYCSFTASFEIGDWKSFSFILLFFKFILPNLGSHSYINFRIGFSFLLTFWKVLCWINLGRSVSYCLSLLCLGLDRSSRTQSAN